ncbi:MAG: hypothetical protein QW429_04250 [Thermoprotei archaeon]
MWSRGVVSIDEKFLQPNYLFAVLVKEGYLFGRVLSRSLLTYKPYDQLGLLQPGTNIMSFPTALYPSGQNAISPANQNQTNVILASPFAPQELHDALYIPPQPGLETAILHGAIGVKPGYVQVYVHYPQGEAFLGRWPTLQPPQPGIGVPYARFDGLESPYEAPTDYRELVIPAGIHLSFEFYLPSRFDPVQPVLNLRFALYTTQIFDPNGPTYQRQLIASIAQRKVPAAFLTFGSAQSPLQFTNISKNYGNIQPITLDQAAQLSTVTGGGG